MGGEPTREKRRDAYREAAGEPVETNREAARSRPTRSTLLFTVIDRAKPWLILSRAFAAVTQPSVGPRRYEWHGQADHPPHDRRALAAPGPGDVPADQIRQTFNDAKADDEACDDACRGEMKHLLPRPVVPVIRGRRMWHLGWEVRRLKDNFPEWTIAGFSGQRSRVTRRTNPRPRRGRRCFLR